MAGTGHRFAPGHPKYGGRKKGQKAQVKLGTIREFLEAKGWDPLNEVYELLPNLSEFQQARINMEIAGMEQRERLAGKLPGEAPKGEAEEAKRLEGLSTADFIASLPVKLDGSNGNGTHPGPTA
jgi:hypothetical protein